MKKIAQIKKGGFFKKADIIIYAALAALTAFCVLYYVFSLNNIGEKALIYHNNELIKTMPLNQNAVFEFEYGGLKNTIAVENGKIFVKDSNCPDGICVSYGKVNTAGRSIICLPHNLKIIITGGGGNGIDF